MCMLHNFECVFFFVDCRFFLKENFGVGESFRNSVNVKQFGPDPVPNCLQIISVDNKSCLLMGKSLLTNYHCR